MTDTVYIRNLMVNAIIGVLPDERTTPQPVRIDLEVTVDTHIAELRRKLEDDPAKPTLIVTVRKAGYRLVAP